MNTRNTRVWDEQTIDGQARQAAEGAQAPFRRPGPAALTVKLWSWRLTVAARQAADRALDLAGASLGILLCAPLMLLTWLAIRMEDGGPAIYVQQRVGRDGVLFPLLKFRSMVMHAESMKSGLSAENESGGGVLFKMRRDPRVTRVGAVIRKLSIDELPQLFNVLRGEMSLVGPRPALPDEVARYRQAHRARLSVKPGITCLWQIGGRSDIDFEGQVRLDVRYIRERSLWNDLLILLRTVPAVLSARGAY